MEEARVHVDHRFPRWRYGLSALLASSAFAGNDPLVRAAAEPKEVVGIPETIPLKREASREAFGSNGWEWGMLGLLLVAVAILGAYRKMKPSGRLTGAGDKVMLQRLASQALTPQASVHCIRWKGEDLLVGCTAGSVTLLARKVSDAAATETDE